MDPRKLIFVLEVAEQGSVSRAAQVLCIAQPSLSRTIRDFEAAVGVRIFERGSRGVTLTPDGERLVARARVIRAELQNAEREITDAKAEVNTPISIGIVPVHPIDPLMEALIDLNDARPGVRVRVETGTRNQMLEALGRGGLELILAPLSQETLGLGYMESIIYHEDLAIFCGPKNRLFGCKTVSLAELAEMNWVLGKKGTTSRRRVDAFFRSQGMIPPDVTIEFEEIPARRSMVLQSNFLTVFQRNHVLEEMRTERIFPIPIPWAEENRPIGVIQLAGLSPSPAAAQFLDAFRKALRNNGVRTDAQKLAK